MKEISIPIGKVTLKGNLTVPKGAKSIVLFSHGSGSSRLSPRNTYVAEVLNKAGIATLLFDLLTEEEDEVYQTRFNIPLLTKRLIDVTNYLSTIGSTIGPTIGSTIGYFGASTGAASALFAAAALGDKIKAVVSRGGRPDLAMEALPKVKSPTLLIVGGDDDVVIGMNETAYDNMSCEKKLEIVPGATHLFEEPGTLERVAELATEWFLKYLG
jgi:dienelactone hydrolase